MSIHSNLLCLKARITSFTGWRRNLLLFALGVMVTLALPPVYMVYLLIPAFTGLAWMVLSAANPRRAFFDGWWFGLGNYMTGLYWMCIALLTDPARFGWLIPFTLIGLNGVIAIYSGVFALLLWKIRPDKKTGVYFAVSFAALWTLVELARGTFFTGFPWNLAGYSWTFDPLFMQTASVYGAYGLTFVTVLLAVLPAALTESRKQAVVGAVVFVSLLVWMVGYGFVRLGAAYDLTADSSYTEGVKLRLVQANIAQHHKWNSEKQMQGLTRHMLLSRSEGMDSVTHVIWPETAIPYALDEESSLIPLLQGAVPEKGYLISGTLRAQGKKENFQIWNSLIVMNEQGEIVGGYDKHHLVPFGEFVPFRSVLPIEKITHGSTDFSRGPGVSTIEIPGAGGASPLICYEAIFPGEVASRDASNLPDWLLVVTNDAWFGHSSGPHQHYQMSRMRAVEEGLPMVRAANTGISAVVDAYGREVAKLDLGDSGVLDSKLPIALAKTTYGSDFKIYILLLVLSVVLLPNLKFYKDKF